MTGLILTALLSQTAPGEAALPDVLDTERVVLLAEEAELHPVSQAVKASLEKDGGKSDKPFTLAVRIETDAPDKVIAAMRKATPKTRAEEGNKAYALHRSADEPDTFLLYERWRSLADLDAHLKTDYIADLLAVLDEEANIELQVMRPVWAGKPAAK